MGLIPIYGQRLKISDGLNMILKNIEDKKDRKFRETLMAETIRSLNLNNQILSTARKVSGVSDKQIAKGKVMGKYIERRNKERERLKSQIRYLNRQSLLDPKKEN